MIKLLRRHLCCNAIVGSLRNARPSGILHTMVLNEPLGGLIVREPTVTQEQRLVKDKLDSLDFWLGDDYGSKKKI